MAATRPTGEMGPQVWNRCLAVLVLAVCSLCSQHVQAETERLRVVLIADKVM